jgi:hypothetical protein
MPTSRYRHIARVPNSVMAFTSPRYALLAILALALMGCAAMESVNELSQTRADGVPTAAQQVQCERMDRLLGDPTLSSQQLEAVRAAMSTHGCQPQ